MIGKLETNNPDFGQRGEDLLELFFSQSLDGFFFMMLDQPVRWDETVNKDEVLDYVFNHHRITKVNQAMLDQYGARPDEFLGLTPRDLFKQDVGYWRDVWRRFFDAGRLHVETNERKFDGTPIVIEGDYICLYDKQGSITGHFGIQRDITARKQMEKALLHSNKRLKMLQEIDHATLAAGSPADIAQAAMKRIHELIPCARASIALFDIPSGHAKLIAVHTSAPTEFGAGSRLPIGVFGTLENLRAGISQHVQDTAVAAVRHKLEPLRREGLRCYANIPMISEGELIGTLNLGADVPQAFSDEHLGIAREVADALAIAIRQTRLREAVLRYAEELQNQNLYLQEALENEFNFGEIIGDSPAIRQVFRSIQLVAPTDTTVLLYGETGTGKELIARAIHNASRRKDQPMINVHCGALPSGLIESELFGHEKGAFTGAISQKKGRFELAQNGTIFLDEIGELSQDLQVKLLRVLQEQQFERVGGMQTISVDVRVIAATNRNLQDEVETGSFRSDLFYRLNIFPIEVPPLRSRKGDIPLLASYFANKFSQRTGKRIVSIRQKALDKLSSYDWPGNVRELANIMERAVILCQGKVLQSEHISGLKVRPATFSPEEFLPAQEAERRHILQALQQTGGVISGPKGAARLLGLKRSTLWSRMRKLGIELPKQRK